MNAYAISKYTPHFYPFPILYNSIVERLTAREGKITPFR